MVVVAEHSRHLSEISVERYGRGVEQIASDEIAIGNIVRRFGNDVDDAATLSTVLKVFRHNFETIITFKNRVSGILGCIAFLPLNSAGHIALAEGRLNTITPDLALICKRGERPVSLYIWGIHICHKTAGGISHAMALFNKNRFKQANLYCKAANPRAAKLFISLGFEDTTVIDGHYRPELMAFKRRPASSHEGDILAYEPHARAPSYASYDPENTQEKTVGIKIVHTLDELLRVMAVRAAAYLPEQDMPYEEDADGNDLCAAHLIGYIGREPAATLRLRFFASFTKIERLAVLPRFRGTSIGPRIVRAGIDYGRDKGYERFYGQTEEAVFPIWRRAGFILRNTNSISYQTDRTYREGDMIAEPSAHAITPYAGAHIILRKEGEWHRPGAFESNEGRA